MLEAVSIRNFRAIRELEVSGLGQVDVLVGRAGSGKSSFLEALAFASYVLFRTSVPFPSLEGGSSRLPLISYLLIRRGQDYLSVSPGQEGHAILSSHSPAPISRLVFGYGKHFEIDISSDAGSVAASITIFRAGRQNFDVSCELKVFKKGKTSPISRKLAFLLRNDGLPEGRTGSPGEAREILSSLGSLMLVDHEVARRLLGLSDVWRELFFGNYDKLVVEALSEALGLRVADLITIPVEPGEFDVLVGIEGERGKIRIYLSDLAEGGRRLIAMALASTLVGEGGTLLVEEPEAHLHPLAMLPLARLSARMFKALGQQVFITTHSLEMADALSRACSEEGLEFRAIFLHREPDGYVEARVLENPSYRELRDVGIDLRVVPEIL